MRYDKWCHPSDIVLATSIDDLNKCINKCNGRKQNSDSHLPPSKFKPENMYGDLNKKEEKNMVVTIIGSLTKKGEIDKIKSFWVRHGAIVNSPEDPKVQKEPLVDTQRTWIKKIEEADLVVAVPKDVALTANGDSKYILEFDESTSYEMAIARRFNKNILFG